MRAISVSLTNNDHGPPNYYCLVVCRATNCMSMGYKKRKLGILEIVSKSGTAICHLGCDKTHPARALHGR